MFYFYAYFTSNFAVFVDGDRKYFCPLAQCTLATTLLQSLGSFEWEYN